MLSKAVTSENVFLKLNDISKAYNVDIVKNENRFTICDRNVSFNCYNDGLFVFNFCFDLENDKDFSYYLEKKEQYTSEILDKNGRFVNFLMGIDKIFLHANINKNYFLMVNMYLTALLHI